MNRKATPAEILLYLVGAAGFAYMVVKGMIIGYYPDEAPMLFGAGLVGAVALFAAANMTKRRNAKALADRDREKGVI